MPAILSRTMMPPLRRGEVLVVRFLTAGTIQPKPPLKQVTVNEQGFFKYDRDWSRDSKAKNPQKPGDTPLRFLTRKIGHAYELYPLFALGAAWSVLFAFIVFISFEKGEVWLDRTKSSSPYDWERIRDSYWKMPTLAFDPKGVTHQRLPLMEQLQDQMVEAARARGTR